MLSVLLSLGANSRPTLCPPFLSLTSYVILNPGELAKAEVEKMEAVQLSSEDQYPGKYKKRGKNGLYWCQRRHHAEFSTLGWRKMLLQTIPLICLR